MGEGEKGMGEGEKGMGEGGRQGGGLVWHTTEPAVGENTWYVSVGCYGTE